MNKIGVLGGSFDPIHLGHISLAKEALVQAGLSQVIFMPVHQQPFKLDVALASDEDRLAMLREVVAEEPGLEVSDLEITNQGISYTYLTLQTLKAQHPETKIYFITGTDSFLKINIWKNAEELLVENTFIIGHRPGYREQELLLRVDEMKKLYQTEIVVMNNRRLDISATKIREMVASGQPISQFVPARVERYIKTHGLYR